VVALVETHGDLAYAYLQAAQYLQVDVDELIFRTEHGQQNWLSWALVADAAERLAQQSLAEQQQAEQTRAVAEQAFLHA